MQGKTESFLYLGTKIFTGTVGFFSFSIQTRYISPDALGDFSLITGFTGVLVAILVSWIGSSGLRYFQQYKKDNELKIFYSTIFIDWCIGLSIAVVVILVCACCLRGIQLKEYIVWIVWMVVFASAMEVLEKLMRAAGRGGIYCALLLVQSVLNILTIIIFYYATHMQIESLFAAKIVTSGVFVLVTVVVLGIFQNINLGNCSRFLNKKFFSYGFPMVGVWGVSWILNYSDRYIIKLFMSSSDVGLYDVAYRFAESSIGLIISSFSLAFFPAMIKEWNANGRDGITKTMKSIFNYYFMLAVPAFLGITLLSGKFYGTILDRQYQNAAGVIWIASLGVVFMGINNLLYKLWQLEEKTNRVLLITIIAVLVNLSANIFLIPLYGYIAAAVTTLISYIVTTGLILFFLRGSFRITIDWKMVRKIILSGVIMSFFIVLVRDKITTTIQLFLVILFSALSYFLLLMIQGCLTTEVAYLKRKIFKSNIR